MTNTSLSFVLTCLAGLSTMLGTIFIFIKNTNENNIITSSLSFASGVMITVSLTDLIPESITLFFNIFKKIPSFLFMTIFVVIGIIFSMLIDKYLPDTVSKNHSNKKLYRIGLISMLAIILHNIPEGIATFMATTQDTKLGISLAIAIALHNIPEGISISIPIYYSTKNKLKALGLTFLSGISEPFGAIVAFLFLRALINDTLMGALLAIIAGIMMHIATYELLPTALKYQKKKRSIIFFIIGIIFMLVNHFLF